MTRKTLDPNLASILESIRATVGGDAPPAAPMETEAEAELEAGASEEIVSEAAVADKAPAAAPARGKKAAVPPAQRSVEDFLADLIRPQVQAWLDAHLPELIQKMAAEEIARLTGRS